MVNREIAELSGILTKNMLVADSQLVCVVAVIVESLCQSGHLERDELIQRLDGLWQGWQLEAEHEASPLRLLLDILRKGDSNSPSPNGRRPPSWLQEVIEGGLSTNPTPESTD